MNSKTARARPRAVSHRGSADHGGVNDLAQKILDLSLLENLSVKTEDFADDAPAPFVIRPCRCSAQRQVQRFLHLWSLSVGFSLFGVQVEQDLIEKTPELGSKLFPDDLIRGMLNEQHESATPGVALGKARNVGAQILDCCLPLLVACGIPKSEEVSIERNPRRLPKVLQGAASLLTALRQCLTQLRELISRREFEQEHRIPCHEFPPHQKPHEI